MRCRWTIKELTEESDAFVLRGLVAERMSDCTNIYSPLHKRLQRLHEKLSIEIETEREIKHGIHPSQLA